MHSRAVHTFEPKKARTGSFDTHYIEMGEGRPLVLIHGGGAGADSYGNWRDCLPRFAQLGFRAIAFDLVGFGHSDAPDPTTFEYTTAARREQLIAFIEALGVGKVSLIGNSMGGATSLAVAMARPDLIEDMILMGSAGMYHEGSPELQSIQQYDFTIEGMKRIVAALTHNGFELDPELLEYRYNLSIDPAVRAAYRATMGWVRDRGGLHFENDEIAAIKTRTLVVQGKDDKVVPMDNGYQFLQLIEGSAGYFVPNCGHWAMIERPELFAEVSSHFLLGKY